MGKEKQERRRKILLKREFLRGKRITERFLAAQSSYNKFLELKMSEYGDIPAITDEYNNIELTYNELGEEIRNFASALQSYGLQKGDFVDIFTENNGRWFPCDQGVMRCGAVCVLRGSNAPASELDYIMTHSDAVGVILKDGKLLHELKPYLSKRNLKFIILMFKSENDDLADINSPVFYYEDVVNYGKSLEFYPVEQSIEDPSTMLYTSGTTGNPKGVLISHKNLLSQMPSIDVGLMAQKGENTLQILPIWHAYEHIAQTYYFTKGCHLHFTTLSGLKNDLLKYKIDVLMSVPRIWEAIRLGIFQKLKQTSHIAYRIFDFAVKLSITYKIHKMYSERRITNKKNGYHLISNIRHKFLRSFLKPFHILFTNTLYKKIKNAAGLNFRASISGGGALSMKDQLFYDAIGVNLREGYGLTETSPVLTLRYAQDPNFLGCCGRPFWGTEIKIIDHETGEELGIFQKGVVYVRGFQVANGYYKDEKATKEVFSDDGWFNTGDLGWLTADNNLVLVGRAKETIVLSSGENVEPVPIEEACLESPYIDQIVLVGQDETSVGALVVPSETALEKCGVLAKNLKSGTNLTIKDQTLRDLIKKEIAIHIKNKQNLKSFEQIKQFEIIKEGFDMKNGLLSQTAKIKRNNVFEKYKTTISEMFNK